MSENESRSVLSSSLRPHGLSMEFSRPEYNPCIEPRSLALQADSIPVEPQGKPKNTGVGSLSLLQGIFPAQELNWSLPHCRKIPYQLNYQGSPKYIYIYIHIYTYIYTHTHLNLESICVCLCVGV